MDGTRAGPLSSQRHAINILMAVACLIWCGFVLKDSRWRLVPPPPLTVCRCCLACGLPLPVGGCRHCRLVISLLQLLFGRGAAAAGFVRGQ